jgi:hypothetical protein
MPKRKKYVYVTGAQPLRNLRLVWMKKERGMSYEEIRQALENEGWKISRQQVANIYKIWKDVPFLYEDDKIIIH